MRFRYHGLLAGWLSLLVLLGPNAAQAALFETTASDLQAEARAAGNDGKGLAIFFSLPDCPGCREMERTVFSDKSVESAVQRNFRGVHLDLASTGKIIDTHGQPTTAADLANRLHVFATPSFVFFNGRGDVLFRYTGTLDSRGFNRLNDFVRRGDYETRPFTPPARKEETPPLHADLPDATLPQYPEFSFAATDGRQHTLADFHGHVVALAVGYTQCPDVCPTTLAEMKAAVEALPVRYRSRIQLLFATLDPERDSISLLGDYAAAFRPAGGRPILGLRGSAEETAHLIRQLQLIAEKQPSASMGYTLDHTAGIFLFAASGRLLGVSPYGQPVKKLSSDLLSIASKK